MNKFSKYTADQLKWAATDIKETLEIWKGEPDSAYVREKELELDQLRDELHNRQFKEIKAHRNKLIKKGVDGLVASMMATWIVREGLTYEEAGERADRVYWGD
jgi:hypothetical protein